MTLTRSDDPDADPNPDPNLENWQLIDNIIRGLLEANKVRDEMILYRVLLRCAQVEKASFSQAELVEALKVLEEKNMLMDRDGEVHLVDY